MTRNQIAMRNLARLSPKAQLGRDALKPTCRARLDHSPESTLKHWQDLDRKKMERKKKKKKVESAA